MSTSRISTRTARPSRFATQLSPSTSPSLATVNPSASSNTNTSSSNANANARTVNDQVSLMAARTAAGRATHRVTVRKTAQQVARLQEMWAQTTTPTKEQREQIAEEIGLDTRIVSTWFRDERSKLTRMRAEQERGSGPIRNTRTGHKQRPSAASIRSESVGIDDMVSDEDTPFDSVASSHAAQPQPQPQQRIHAHARTHTPQDIKLTVTDPYEHTTRYSPYRTPQRLVPSPISKASASASDRHDRDRFDSQPVLRRSAPIDIYRHQNHPHPHPHPLAAPMETDQESLYYTSPGMSSSRLVPRLDSCPCPPQEGPRLTAVTGREYQRLSVPAPSPMSDAYSNSSSSEDEDEIEAEGEDEVEEDDDIRETSAPLPRTPLHLPSSLPSPRVIHASSTSPYRYNTTSSTSPYRGPIILHTESGGTHTFEPLPAILGPQPNRDSSWRWNYYDKVSSLRKTLENTLYHSDKSNSNRNTNSNSNGNGGNGENGDEDESDASPGPSPRGLGVVDLDENSNNSPRMRNTKMEETGVLDRFDRLGLFPRARKQFFVTPTAYDPTKMA